MFEVSRMAKPEKKKAKQGVNWNDDICKKYPTFVKGRTDCEAQCIICGNDTCINIYHHGQSDLSRHVHTDKHTKAVENASRLQSTML